MSAFRLAFIGLDHPHGAGWRKALSNLGPEIEITAIVPRFGGRTASLEERHAGAARFETVEALIADGRFDGAIVCLPNNEAPQTLVQLAAAGKHVLAEKPAAGSASDARKIAAVVRASGVAFQSGYMWRYDPGVDRLRDMVTDGRFGKLISVEMNFITSNVAKRGPDHYLFDPAISSGGFFNWLACHWLDLLLHLTGETVLAVTARVGVFGDTPVEVEDGGTAILELSGGGLATFIGGYWFPRWSGESRWSIRGRDRWVHWEPSRPGTGGVIEIHGPQPQWDAMDEVFTIPPDNTPGYGGRRSVDLLQDWLRASRGEVSGCRNTPESMVAVLDLLDAIYQSSREGRRIELNTASDKK